jgi:branched-chain amino acid transport system substrate-binding protein
MRFGWTMVLVGALFASPASAASTSGTNQVRDLAFRAGPIVGAALVCRSIARSRLQVIVDKFHTLIREAASQEAERAELAQVFDRNITDGTNQLTSGKSDCITAHGVTEREIRFGIVMPFGGTRREAGRQLKLGIEAAFQRENEAGGINGRMLKLIAADHGYDPARTLATMKQLYEKDQVSSYIGNIGTANAAVGATSLANELKLLGPHFTNVVLVSQIVPAVAGHSGVVLDYKNALANISSANRWTTPHSKASSPRDC